MDANDPVAVATIDPQAAILRLQGLVSNLTAKIEQIEYNEDQDARNLNSVSILNSY